MGCLKEQLREAVEHALAGGINLVNSEEAI